MSKGRILKNLSEILEKTFYVRNMFKFTELRTLKTLFYFNKFVENLGGSPSCCRFPIYEVILHIPQQYFALLVVLKEGYHLSVEVTDHPVVHLLDAFIY